MKEPEEYLARAGEKCNKGLGISRETALEAIRACLKDHQDYCDRMSKQADRLSEMIKEARETLKSITQSFS